MKPTTTSGSEHELAIALELWPTKVTERAKGQLRTLVDEYSFSASTGDIQLLNSRWYVTHAGLLRLAQRQHCNGIHTELLPELSDPQSDRWVFKATVFKTARSKGFVGFGDADPSNVSPLVRGAELRVAETRAVNRALRKAYGIGLCSVEELGNRSATTGDRHQEKSSSGNGNGHGQARLRDRLLLLIRQHQLDAEQVKHYAAHFCGVTSLRQASRAQVESLIDHLTALAGEGGERLLAELQSVSDGAGQNQAEPESASSIPAIERKEAA
jgi:hypothetical protein